MIIARRRRGCGWPPEKVRLRYARMEFEAKRNLQIVLVVGVLLAALRTGYILYERKQDAGNDHQNEAPTVTRTVDDYVYVRPMHITDLESAARTLKGKGAWIKAGCVVGFYPMQGSSVGRQMLGTLPPLMHIKIKSVVRNGDQIMAV